MDESQAGATTPYAAPRPAQSWVYVLVLFGIASAIEGLGISQVFAFLPLYLRELGLPADEAPQWVGLLTALTFVGGLPLVPLWGAWADKYSRKGVIVRSALVEMVVYGLMALSRQPWHLAVAMLIVGFALGNTGIMLALMRDVTPTRRLGTAITLFSAASPIGFAIGPVLGGVMVDGFGWSLAAVYAVEAALSLAVAVMLAAGMREVRPAVIPTGKVLALAFGAIRSIFTDRVTRNLFTVFGVALLAQFMTSPYLPILTEQVHGSLDGLASAVALVVGTAALVGGLVSPVAGMAGDRFGFRPMLIVALGGYALMLLAMPVAGSVALLAVLNGLGAALGAALRAMIFALLSTDVAPQQRSATLNLAFVPLYLAGIVGPAIGAGVVTVGLAAPFVVAAASLAGGTVFVLLRLRRAGSDAVAAG